MTHETVEEYLARGGTITKSSEWKTSNLCGEEYPGPDVVPFQPSAKFSSSKPPKPITPRKKAAEPKLKPPSNKEPKFKYVEQAIIWRIFFRNMGRRKNG